MVYLDFINIFAVYNLNNVNMNVKLRLLTIGVLFFSGHTLFAQEKKKSDTAGSEKKIDEVVIQGYNKVTTKPKDMSAATTVTAEIIENRPNVSFINSIQGTAPGVTVSSASGSPGSAKIDIIIRGLSTLNASTDPLYVVDGVAYSANEFRNINVNDIESIRIEKDASGTSIYGNRGANGVVLIRTKQAKYNSKFKVLYTGMTGVSTLPQNKYNVANTRELLTLQENYKPGTGISKYTEDELAALPDTNWLKYFFKPAITRLDDVQISSGGQNLSSYTSLGYFYQGGMVPTTDFQRFTVRNNINGKSDNDRFTFNSQIALGYSKRNQLDEETNSGISNNVVQNPLHGSLLGLPYLSPNSYSSGTDLYNAIGTDFNGGKYIYVLENILQNGNLPSYYRQTSVLANFSGSYKLTPYLTFSNKAGVDYKRNDRVFARAPWSYLALAVAGNELKYPGFEIMSSSTDFTFNNVASLSFHKDFGDHSLDLGAYTDYVKSHYLYTYQEQNGLDSLNWVPGAGTGYVSAEVTDGGTINYLPDIGATKINAGSFSYFATLDYDYSSKYGLGAVIRRDASYRFTDDYKWGTFWSVSGRWNIDKENFMDGSVFNILKLRGSYGTQGNQNVIASNYGINPLLTATNLTRDLNTNAITYNYSNSYILSQIANPDLRWEKISQANIGVDFELFNSKLVGSIDVYQKITDGLYNDIQVSAVTGISYSYNGNNGKMENKGIEFSLRYNVFRQEDFKLSIFANGSYNKNKIKKILGDFQDNSSYANAVGHMAYEWYLVPYVGVNPENGQALYLSADGSTTETPQAGDRKMTGKSFMPKYQGGFGFDIDFKGFFVNTLFSYQLDAWKWDNEYSWLMDPTAINSGYNVSADLLNAWSQTNTNTNIPSLAASNLSPDIESDRFLIDASFLKLRSFTVGWNLPKKFIGDSDFVRSLKIYVQGENLFIATKWKGFDPEGFKLYPLGNYPNPRTISLGATVEF